MTFIYIYLQALDANKQMNKSVNGITIKFQRKSFVNL